FPMRLDAMPKTLPRAAWEKWGLPRTGERGYGLPALAWHPDVEEEGSVALPAGGRLKLDPDGRLLFPVGTVFIRNFLVFTHPALRPPWQPIETRVVVVRSENTAFGCSYRWPTLREAELVEEGEFTSCAAGTEAGDPRKILWWHPAAEVSFSLGTTDPAYGIPQDAAELNIRTDKRSPTLLQRMIEEGSFDPMPASEQIRGLPEMERWTDDKAPIEARVRSYLHANCAGCHQPGGTARGNFDARIATPLDRTGLILGELAAGDLGITGAKIVVPGVPEKSILYRRLKSTDFFRMPPVQYHNVPSPILPVMEEWIRQLNPR